MLKNNNITLSGTAGAATAHISDCGDHVTYNVAVSGMTSSAGTVIASVPAHVAQNSAGVWNDASTSIGNSVAYDYLAPTYPTNVSNIETDCDSVPDHNFKFVENLYTVFPQ